jgi:hypothetical protein
MGRLLRAIRSSLKFLSNIEQTHPNDHRGILVNFPLGALARLQLGRAYTLSVDAATAKTAYQGFLTLWKEADPDIPILKEAKAEYAKLQ